MTNESHTAIPCKHPVANVRAFIEDIITIHLKDVDADIDNYASLVTALTNLTMTVMWEHSQEISSEYQTIISRLSAQLRWRNQ